MLQIKRKERIKLRFALIVALAGAVVISGCTATPRTSPLETSIKYEYKQDDDTLIAATFSGGGMRAAALAYGALMALRETEKSKNGQTLSQIGASAPDSCCKNKSENENAGRCQKESKATQKSEDQKVPRLIDKVDLVSAVSGGGVTAAYWALKGPDDLHMLKERFLCKDVQGQLIIETIVNPIRWLQLLMPYYSRIDIFRDYLEEELFELNSSENSDSEKDGSRDDQEVFDKVFEGATYNNLMDNKRPKRPYLILNATDMATGKVFSFTPEMFGFLCADLTKFKLADAVAASSAYPVALTALTVKNYRPDQECLVALKKLGNRMDASDQAEERELELALATAKGEVKAKQQALEEAQRQKRAVELDLGRAQGQVEAKEQALKEAEKEVKAKRQALATAEKQVKAKRQALEEAMRQNQALEVALVRAEGEVKAKRQALEKAKGREQALEVVLATAKGQVEAKRQALATAEEREQRLEVVLATAEREVKAKQQALGEAQGQKRAVELDLERAKGQVEAKTQVLVTAKEREQRLEVALATVEGEVEAKRQALEEAQGQNQALEVALATVEGEAKTKRQTLEEVKRQNQTLEVALATAKEQVEAMMQALEKAKEQEQAKELDVARAEEQAEAKQRALEEAQGQKRAVELDLERAQGEVKAKTQALEVVRGQNQALELDLKTAEEQVEAKQQALGEAQGQKHTVELDLGRAQEQVEAKQQALGEAQGQKHTVELDLGRAQGQVQAKKHALDQAEEQVTAKKQALEAAKKKLENLTLKTLQARLSGALSAQPHDYDDKKTQYVHFLDGGIADNVGLTPLLGLLDPIVTSIVDQKNSEATLPKSIAVIVVNARADPPNDYGKRDTPPCCIDTLVTTIGAATDSTSLVLLEQLEHIREELKRLEQIQKASGRMTPAESEMFIVDVSLDSINKGVQDDSCRRWFQNIPTSWSLEAQQVEALIKIGRALVLDSSEYEGLVGKLGYEKPDKTVSEVCQVCEEVLKSSNLHHSLPEPFAKGTVEVS